MAPKTLVEQAEKNDYSRNYKIPNLDSVQSSQALIKQFWWSSLKKKKITAIGERRGTFLRALQVWISCPKLCEAEVELLNSCPELKGLRGCSELNWLRNFWTSCQHTGPCCQLLKSRGTGCPPPSSDCQSAHVLIRPVHIPTTRLARKAFSVSPERWVPQHPSSWPGAACILE